MSSSRPTGAASAVGIAPPTPTGAAHHVAEVAAAAAATFSGLCICFLWRVTNHARAAVYPQPSTSQLSPRTRNGESRRSRDFPSKNARQKENQRKLHVEAKRKSGANGVPPERSLAGVRPHVHGQVRRLGEAENAALLRATQPSWGQCTAVEIMIPPGHWHANNPTCT